MAVFKSYVVFENKIYCWDTNRQRYVKIVLEVDEDASVPDEAKKLIAMKQFDLVERKVSKSLR